MYEGGERCIRILVGRPEGRNHLEDPGVEGMIILKWILKWNEGMDWIDLVQDRDKWRSLMNAVMKLRVPKHRGQFLDYLRS
jgi:hypothetical protein